MIINKKISTPAELTAAAATAGITIENLRTQIASAAAGCACFTTKADGSASDSTFGIWIRDLVAPAVVGGGWCAIVSAANGKTYEQDFSIVENKITLTGEPREVVANVEYVTAPAEAGDVPGHDFHGNQHTSATSVGAKKDSAKADDASLKAASEGGRENHQAAVDANKHAESAHIIARGQYKEGSKEYDYHTQAAHFHGDRAASHEHQIKLMDRRDNDAAERIAKKADAADATAPKLFALEATGDMLGEAPDAASKFEEGFCAMAGGIRTVTLGCMGSPVTVSINVNPDSAKKLQAQLEAVNASGKQRCFNCFDHGGSRGQTAASSWPKKFYWNTEKKAVYEIAEPSQRGLEAVDGKIYRGFSMTFFTNAEITEAADGGWEIKKGRRGSPQNPASIICPLDASTNPTAYLNMGTMTNKPAFSANEPLFAAAPVEKKNVPQPVAAAPVRKPQNKNRNTNMETQLDAAALQTRNTQLETRIVELEAEDTAIAKAQLEAARSELSANQTKLQLVKLEEKNKTLEASETSRKKKEAVAAVAIGIEAQAIPMLNKELQAEWADKFTADPTLIPLMTASWQAGRPAGGRTRTPNAASAMLGYGAVKTGAGPILEAMSQLLVLQKPFGKSLDASACEKRSIIAKDIAVIYRNEVRSKTMELDAEGNARPGINPDFLMAPLEAATDADGLGTLAGTLVSMRYLDIFMYKLPLISNGKIMTDFSDQPSDLNQQTSTRKIVVPGVIGYDPTLDTDGYPKGWNPVSAPQTTDINITLDELIGSPIQYDLATLSSTQRQLFMEQAPAAAYANALYFLKKIYAVCTAGNFNAYANVTAADANGIIKVPVAYPTYPVALIDFARSKLADIAAAFDANEVPDEDRSILLNSQYYNKATTDPSVTTFFAGQQAPEIVTQGRLPNLAGFVPIKAPNFPGTNNRFGIALQKNGLIAKSRLPNNLNQVMPGAGNGSVTQIVHPETGVAMLLVQWVDQKRGYAAWLPCAILGAAKGDIRGGLVGTTQ